MTVDTVPTYPPEPHPWKQYKPGSVSWSGGFRPDPDAALDAEIEGSK